MNIEMATINIKLGNNTLTGVDTISLTNAADTTKTDSFVYGNTPSATTSVKLGNNTLSNISSVVVKDANNNDATFGYQASAPASMTIHLSSHYNGGYCDYKVNDGNSTQIAEWAEVDLTNVTKLEIFIPEGDYGEIWIGTTGYDSSDIANIYSMNAWRDITSYLQDGCYVTLYGRD